MSIYLYYSLVHVYTNNPTLNAHVRTYRLKFTKVNAWFVFWFYFVTLIINHIVATNRFLNVTKL